MKMGTGRNVARKEKVYGNSARLTIEHRRPGVRAKTDGRHFAWPHAPQDSVQTLPAGLRTAEDASPSARLRRGPTHLRPGWLACAPRYSCSAAAGSGRPSAPTRTPTPTPLSLCPDTAPGARGTRRAVLSAAAAPRGTRSPPGPSAG